MSAIAPTGGTLAPAAKPFTPITLWAFIGLIFIVVIAYSFGAWIFGPDFRAVPGGADDPPGWMSITAHSIEVITILAFAATAYKLVVQPLRRDGRLSTDGLMVLALITLYWQNTLPNWFGHTTLLSTVFTNYGSWYGYIPGWNSPNMEFLPEAPIAWGLCYACWFVYFPMRFGGKGMLWLRARYPRLSPTQAFLVAWAVFMAFDFVLEGFFLRTGMYSYPGAISELTVWAGETYQFPFYETLTWGFAWTVYATVYAYRDDQGRTIVERGVDKLQIPRRRRTLYRYLALVGVFNLIFFAQNMLMATAAFHADPFPEGYTSYQLGGLCGPGTDYECNNPDVPLAKDSAPTNRIDQRSDDVP